MIKWIKMSILFCAVILTIQTKAQVYNPVSYAINKTPDYGVKIVTNLPFTDGSQMPTIILEGYNYAEAKPIQLTLVYYIYGGAFYNPNVSSSTSYQPPIKLANEGGKVIIFIDDRKYFNRFNIRAFAQGMGEVASWFTGWTIKDEALVGTNVVTVPYDNILSRTNDGNVGIGTISPTNSLTVQKVSGGAGFSGTSGNGGVRVNWSSGYGIALDAWDYNSPRWGITKFNVNTPTVIMEGQYNSNNVYFNSGGNVGIGTTNPTTKLAVNGTIRCQEVLVEASPWPDYVFAKDYKLKSINEVDTYIKAHNHLPDMPAASYVEQNGVKLSELNTKLLQKVEELTLYLIEQNKKTENLNNEFAKQQSKEKLLEEQNELLKQEIELLKHK